MKGLLLKLEPLIWLLFGQGIMISTILLTGWILVVGLLYPLGIVPEHLWIGERAHMLAAGRSTRGGHHGLGIPIEDARDCLQPADLVEAGGERLVAVHVGVAFTRKYCPDVRDDL